MQTIDKDGAIEHFQNIIQASDTTGKYNEGFIDGLEFCISHLSTMPIIEQSEWTLCSTQYPKSKKQAYLVLTEDNVIYQCRWTDENPFWYNNLKTNWHWSIFDKPAHTEIIAWMPLPKGIKNNKKQIKIKDIGLLSVEEYYKYKNYIKPIDNWWWLRSPGIVSYCAASVNSVGDVVEGGLRVKYSDGSVRPILIVKNGPEIGKTFVFGNKNWTIISENIALCDESFCQMPFRKNWLTIDSNKYEFSDIKQYLDNWLEKNNIDF